ncbi:MAG TPA: SRPBCC domain-containing protein [Vicinamibacterales bacterium]|nr:SRPBCC domain-containing protein [Vicinamibacterales bacterium]
MSSIRLYRVIIPVADLDAARHFYATLLEQAGTQVSPGRHYFTCGDVILALYSPSADGDSVRPYPNFDHVYLAVDSLEAAFERAETLGGLSTEVGDGQLPMGRIALRPWGERSFYLRDPFGNPLCLVDSATIFTGMPVGEAADSTRSISRELELPLDAEATFALLHTPSAIRVWWSAARAVVAPRAGGIWVATWGPNEDAPEYTTAARILVWDPPRRLRLGQFEYYTADRVAPPFIAALETAFSVRSKGERSILRVHQTGFPSASMADDFFSACERGWAATFEGIARYVAEGRADAR